MGNVLTEITSLTNHIRADYPELYELLEENNMPVEAVGTEVKGDEFTAYLSSMQERLNHYIENHKQESINTAK